MTEMRVDVVNSRTLLVYRGGSPYAVLTTARDYDAAMDAAMQRHGAPLDYGAWHDGLVSAHDDLRDALDEAGYTPERGDPEYAYARVWTRYKEED